MGWRLVWSEDEEDADGTNGCPYIADGPDHPRHTCSYSLVEESVIVTDRDRHLESIRVDDGEGYEVEVETSAAESAENNARDQSLPVGEELPRTHQADEVADSNAYAEWYTHDEMEHQESIREAACEDASEADESRCEEDTGVNRLTVSGSFC